MEIIAVTFGTLQVAHMVQQHAASLRTSTRAARLQAPGIPALPELSPREGQSSVSRR